MTLRLTDAFAGDWDLAVFDELTGRSVGASSSFGALERVDAFLTSGQQIVIQACRRTGSVEQVPLTIDFVAFQLRRPTEKIALVSVPIAGSGDLARLEQLGFDLAEDSDPATAVIVTYSDRDRERLRAGGFEFQTLVADLAAQDRADRLAEAAFARRSGRSVLPSGRTTYRRSVEYQDGGTRRDGLKNLVEDNPGLVRPVVLPQTNPAGGSTIEGRPIEGIEIAADVNRTDDGRPVYVQMGLHHVREWPGGEVVMEHALDLVRGYKPDEPDNRITKLLRSVRVIILPVINPDGFVVSRDQGGTMPGADDNSLTTLGLALNDAGAYKRKNCRATPAQQMAEPCITRSGGVDLNRNYGAYWGGVGSSTDSTSQAYRGTGPYSEPESEAVHRFSQRLQIVTLITNHTFTSEGTFLRQPGFRVQGDEVPDEVPGEAGMRALGDAMRNQTGYLSQLGWKLGDITGATEDWNYFAQGTFGYTPELRGTNFHMNYQDGVVGEYEGEMVAARGSDPTPNDPSEDAVLAGDFRGKGVREAYLLAAEQAANPLDHSVLIGTAPAGRTLRLRKTFQTATSRPGIFVDDTLDTVLTVPASGRYEWHVNPSTRPLSATKEAYSMTCEDGGGAVLETKEVTVDRGQQVTTDFSCDGSTTVVPSTTSTTGGPTTTSTSGPSTTSTTGGATTGTPPPPARRASGRRFLISRRSKRQDRRGFVRVLVSCRQSTRCRGTLRLRSASRLRSGRAVRRVALGQRSFSVPARRRSVILVRITKSARRLLRRERTIRVLAIANIQPEAGTGRRLSEVGSFRLVRPRLSGR